MNMSSTDERKLQRFFQKELSPAAAAIRTRGIELFPLGPDPERESYWEPGPEDEPEFIEILPDDFAAALEEYWNAKGLPELAALAAPLMAMARELEIQQEQSEELSPFLYVMY
jgi:hypothetical protein